MDTPLSLLTISDMHVGSAYGMMPGDFYTSAGTKVNLNSGQRYLMDCWEHFVGCLPEKIDVLVLNGDMVEGQNLAEQCRGLVEVDPNFQARATASLLEPVVKRVAEVDGQRQIYMTRGSRYHVGRGGGIEEVLGLILQAAKGPHGAYTQPWLHLPMDDVLFDIAHRQSFTIRYRSMPLEREISFFLERVGRQRKPPPDHLVIVRSHTHSGYRMYEEQYRMAVSTPCWKLQDDFAQTSITPNRMFPDNIGSVGFRIYPEEIDGRRVQTIPYLYSHPG